MSKANAKADKGKSVKQAKAEKGRKGRAEVVVGDDGAIRIGAHPRARRSVRRARAWAGMGGFALVLLLAMRAGVPLFEAMARALAVGIVLHLATWAFAITLWRRLIIAELEAARARLRAETDPPPAAW